MRAVGDISRLLVRWGDGDRSAVDELMPLVYEELRRLARGHLRQKRAEFSLQSTSLVHEAYLRMVNQHVSMESRSQFYGLASKLMRNILVDAARSRHAAKRGGDLQQLSLGRLNEAAGQDEVDLPALDDALNELAAVWPRPAQAVEMRFFGGLTIEETAGVLGISHATVEREWAFARAWLRRKLRK